MQRGRGEGSCECKSRFCKEAHLTTEPPGHAGRDLLAQKPLRGLQGCETPLAAATTNHRNHALDASGCT